VVAIAALAIVAAVVVPTTRFRRRDTSGFSRLAPLAAVSWQNWRVVVRMDNVCWRCVHIYSRPSMA